MPKYNLLRSKRPIVADPDLATNIGLNEAIILQKFNFLIDLNQENQNPKSFQEGKWWTFNSYKAWHEKYFYWWGLNTVKRAILSLEKQEIIEKGNFNKAGFDKTNWYTINYNSPKLYKNTGGMGQRLNQNGPAIDPKSTSGQNQNGSTDTIEETYNTTIEDNQQKQATESDKQTKLDISSVGAYFEKTFGRLLGSSEIQLFDSFSNDVSTDMAKFAIDIAKDNGANSVGYIRAIFRNWNQKQLRTLEDVKRDNQDFKSKGKLDSSNDRLDNSKNGVGDEIIDHGNGQVDF